MTFNKETLALNWDEVLEGLYSRIRELVGKELKRKGAVVGLSGGIDSTVTAALMVEALGKERVIGLFMPEHDSSPESERLGKLLSSHLGIESHLEDIGPALEGLDCYQRRDEAIKRVFPEFGPGYKQKIALHGNILEKDRLNFFKLVIESPAGEMKSKRLPVPDYLQIVAASNMKQRLRTLIEYYHAEKFNYVVAGTPNRLEYDQGFFVKGGDGLADVKPIAHLYKSQVFDLARYLGLPAEIIERPPTTDTYSLEQSQEEFFFALPYDQMDLMLYAHNEGIEPAEAGAAAGLTVEQVKRVFRDIEAKRRTTRILHLPAQLLEDVPQVGH